MLTTRERPNRLEDVTTGGAAGESIKRRRIALGMTVKALADAAGVDRGRLSAIEDGAKARTSTLGAIEAALSRFEEEIAGPYDENDEPGGGLVTFRMSGDFGVDVVVQGPVENLAELEQSVDRLIQRMRSKDSGK